MCGRFSMTGSREELEEEFGLPFPEYQPRYNIAPAQPVWTILVGENGTPRAVRLRWGLIPAWAKDPAIGHRMINARAETLAEKPAYRGAFARRRCLILTDGFYEWQRVGGRKVPMRIRLASGRPFALGGIWEECDLPDGTPVQSCAIVTTAASEFMRPIHERMPLILARGERERWIDPATNRATYEEMLRPYVGEDLKAYAVSTLVNSPTNDTPEVIEPV